MADPVRVQTLPDMEAMMPLIRETLEMGRSIRFSPNGKSMLPMLRQGKDSVVISPCPATLRKYDLPLYRRPDGKYILHRVVGVGGSYICMGDNQFVSEEVCREQVIALVTGFYRADRYHSTDEPLYRLYCIFWHRTRFVRRCWRGGIRRLRRLIS